MYVSQVIMASLPNIEIVSLLIIVFSRKFGFKTLYSVYIFVFCEIVTYGIHIWVINYIYVWAILCITVCLIKRIDNNIIYGLVAAIFGLMFGTLCSLPYFITGGITMGISYIISGFWFDIVHCFANLILTLVLYTPLTKVMDKSIKYK